MSAKENAKQAWKEILGAVGVENGKTVEAEPEAAEPIKPSFEGQTTPSYSVGGNQREPLFAGNVEPKTYPVSIISEGMTVNGSVTVKGDLELRGSLKGDIKGEGNILVTGKQLGNLDCSKDVTLNMATIQGNVSSKGTLNLDKDSVIVGDVVAENAMIDGKLKGALDVKDSVSFQKDAVLMGDVTADIIAMNEGAQIVGKVKTMGASIPPVRFDDEFLIEKVEEKKVEIRPEIKTEIKTETPPQD